MLFCMFGLFKKGDPTLEYSKKIFLLSHEATNIIRPIALCDDPKFEKGIGDTRWFTILQEFMYFFLHLTARQATTDMDEGRCKEIMDELCRQCIVGSVEIICKDCPDDMKDNIIAECTENYYTSMQEYTKFKQFFPDKDDSPKGTLFWEFGKTVARINNIEYDIACIMAAQDAAAKSLKELRIQDSLRNMLGM